LGLICIKTAAFPETVGEKNPSFMHSILGMLFEIKVV